MYYTEWKIDLMVGCMTLTVAMPLVFVVSWNNSLKLFSSNITTGNVFKKKIDAGNQHIKVAQ